MAMVIKLEGDKELERMLKRCKSKTKLRACVKRSGATLQRYAMKNAPYDTGNLRRSLTLRLTDGGMTAECGTPLEYGVYQEVGTRFMNAHPYLKPALETAGAEFKANIRAVVESETRG